MSEERENTALSVLIIDDSPEIADILACCFNALGIQTGTAPDGNTGLALARRKKFDLALIDLGLPDMDGLDVCQSFKADKELKHVPIIIMTGRESTDDKVRAFELGVVDYLNKPFNLTEMQARVMAALKRKRTLDSQTEATNKERQHTLKELRRISKAVDSASDSVSILDAAGKTVYVNSAFQELFGGRKEHCPENAGNQLFARPEIWNLIWEICSEGNSWSGEVELRNADDKVIPALCRANALLDESGEMAGAVFIYTDITQRKRLESDLRYLADFDPLTGLPNRRRFGDFLSDAIAQSQEGISNYLLYLDLDNFKVVNNSAGHQAGDRLLKEIAHLLREQARNNDLLAHFGGDEFTLLLKGISHEDTNNFAARLVQTLDEYRFVENGKTFSATASIGIARVDGNATAEDLLSHAAAACDLAKVHGRNGFVFFAQDNDEIHHLSHEAEWSIRTKDALRADRMELWIQPILPLNGHRSRVYFEALLRMRAPDGKLILPGAFMSAAEHFGNMQQLDQFVMQRGFSLMKAHPSLNLSINLSAKTLNDPTLPDFIEGLLGQTNVLPERVSFEVTETTMIQNLAQARNLILHIRKLGCRFALDDFGSGASSMIYLRDLPVDYLKIDGCFIKHLDTDKVCRALVKSMNEVAHTLGKQTVAEFVVNQEVLKVVRDLGIDYAQGWHICEPAPPDQFVARGIENLNLMAG